MINYTGPISIMLINTFILFDLWRAYLKHRYNSNELPQMLFNLTRLLFIANTFAWVTGFLDYFIFHSTIADVLQFGRFADRYVMFFAYKCLASYNDKHPTV